METKTSDKIIQSAFKLFLEKGYEATNVRDICREVGIKASSMYFYYKSKQDLFFYIYDEIISEYLRFIQGTEILMKDISVEEKLYTLLKCKMEYYAADISKRKFILRYHLFPPEEITSTIREKYRFFTNEENKILFEAIERCRNKKELKKEKIDYYLLVYKRLEDYLEYQMTVSNIKLNDNAINKLWATLSDNSAI
ncbi:MAG: TetR/AcrR family transcriptional regulator [Bacillota bacterium]|nr:TetR/AcrR family transcriptional regulator [Bacillota bacterium]